MYSNKQIGIYVTVYMYTLYIMKLIVKNKQDKPGDKLYIQTTFQTPLLHWVVQL